jgi:ribose/xylose/arabinose/galactoside ABC-type transport system permease subunit
MSQTVWAVISFVYAVLMAAFAVCLWRADRRSVQNGTGWSLGLRMVVVAAVFLAVVFLIGGVKMLRQ